MNGRPLIEWDWVMDHLPGIGERLGQHVLLTVLAVAIGFVISFVIGIAVARRRRAFEAATASASILYTIPSLALFAALVPFTGKSIVTIEIGLVAYTLLILIRNIVAGLVGVPPEIREAARAMGYTPWQELWRVDLPIATPVIIAGLRIATVSTVGLATVAALVSEFGLGVLLGEGIQTFFSTKIYVGAALAVLLAVAADLLFVALQRGLTPWARRRATV